MTFAPTDASARQPPPAARRDAVGSLELARHVALISKAARYRQVLRLRHSVRNFAITTAAEQPRHRASVRWLGLGLGTPFLHAPRVQGAEIDGVEQQRRKTALARQVRYQAPGEGKQQGWAIDQQKRLQ